MKLFKNKQKIKKLELRVEGLEKQLSVFEDLTNAKLFSICNPNGVFVHEYEWNYRRNITKYTYLYSGTLKSVSVIGHADKYSFIYLNGREYLALSFTEHVYNNTDDIESYDEKVYKKYYLFNRCDETLVEIDNVIGDDIVFQPIHE